MVSETKRQLLSYFLAPLGVLIVGVLFFVAHVERRQHYSTCEKQCSRVGARFVRDLAFPPFIVPECRCEARK
jgi:hypothetical protein